MAYDINGRAFDPNERGGMLSRAVALVVTALFIIMLTAFIMSDAPHEEPDPHILSVDITNAAQMHEYGLPTKADVVEWHVHGQWAYMANGHSFVYADLPGGSSVWDDLYDISTNPVFVK